jgi:trigger factor
MGEIVQDAVNESSEKAVKDNALKPAFPPKVDLVSEFQQVVDGKADLEFTLKVDLMPEFDVVDVASLKVERLVGEVTDADVEDAINRVAAQSRTWSPRADGEAAQKDDAVVIDFAGTINGVPFEGGKAENFNLILGSGQLIPGFEDQLIGARKDEARTVAVTFPSDYSDAKLAGKDASFAISVKEVKTPDTTVIDDDLAKRLGLDSLATLNERVREQLKADFSRASRLHMKRRILDALDVAHSFTLPPAMVESEFAGIWTQVETELKNEGKTAADEGKTEDELKAEYRAIAERRVRLGLVLARVGEQNGITITAEEVQRAVAARARQFPGQEQQVVNFYANNQQALAEVRAPIFEDKVVDFIAELAEVTDRKVDRETLFLDPDEAAEKLKDK